MPSKLVNDLNSVATIVGNLGRNIALAQKMFNAEYVENIRQTLGLIIKTMQLLPKEEQNAAFIVNMLQSLAPPRYQYTSTTLDVRMDLAQRTSLGLGGAIGGAIGAVTVSASGSYGKAESYRAAAQLTTVIEAISPNEEVTQSMISRAKANAGIPADQLPQPAALDKEIQDQVTSLANMLKAGKPNPNVPTDPAAG